MIGELSYQGLAILAAAGVLATIVNVMAGGGGMIVLPVLMALGLPADVANGTYRLGVVTQSVAGTAALNVLHARAVAKRAVSRSLGPFLDAHGGFVAPAVPGGVRIVIIRHQPSSHGTVAETRRTCRARLGVSRITRSCSPASTTRGGSGGNPGTGSRRVSCTR